MEGVLFFLALQFGAFCAVIRLAGPIPFPPEAVVVYTGSGERIPAGLRLAQTTQAPYFFASRIDPTAMDAEAKQAKGLVAKIEVDGLAETTDGNARAAAGFLKSHGIRRAVLVTSWYHMPRALLLTRLYLSGSKADVRGWHASPSPKRFYLTKVFWREYFNMWGSLYRVIVHELRKRRAAP